MNEEVTRSTAAFLADHGSSAAFGMIGAAILYVVMPPLDKNGKFNRKEFVLRLFVAGIFSIFFGDMVAASLQKLVPWLEPMKHTSTIDLLVGAPGWWISRAVALWFYRRNDKDIGEIIKESQKKSD